MAASMPPKSGSPPTPLATRSIFFTFIALARREIIAASGPMMRRPSNPNRSHLSRLPGGLSAWMGSSSDSDRPAELTQDELFRERLAGSKMKLIDLADQFTSLHFAILLGQ
jgi:hypothetical protein